MATLFADVRFPGIADFVRASFTRSHGKSPSACILEVPASKVLPIADGTLTFAFAGLRWDFPACRVDQFSSDGKTWTLRILDRRWRWRYGKISGFYNLRNEDETLDATTEKTPQQLAALLLTAMGETGFNVAQLPNDTRPLVGWDAVNPADELEELCNSLGCRIVLRLDNRVQICRLGVGKELPLLPEITEESGSIDPPDGPDLIEWLGGHTRVQATLLLEAVGRDTDGTWKLIDNLSYKPSAGWGRSIPGSFLEVSNLVPSSPASLQANPRELAKQTVFKCYRIKSLFGDGAVEILKRELGPAFAFDFNNIRQFLPLGTELLQADGNATPKRNLPAFVQGCFYRGDARSTNSHTYENYPRPFRIIPDDGIVEFEDYVYKTGTTRTEATLYLITSFSVKQPDQRWPHRFVYQHKTGLKGITGPQVVKEDDVSLALTFLYQGSRISRVTSNQAELRAEATKRVAAELFKYQTKRPYDHGYAGIIGIELDGAIQQVTWEIPKAQPATTRASRNNEYHLDVPNFAERRFREQVRGGHIQQVRRQMQTMQRRATQ